MRTGVEEHIPAEAVYQRPPARLLAKGASLPGPRADVAGANAARSLRRPTATSLDNVERTQERGTPIGAAHLRQTASVSDTPLPERLLQRHRILACGTLLIGHTVTGCTEAEPTISDTPTMPPILGEEHAGGRPGDTDASACVADGQNGCDAALIECPAYAIPSETDACPELGDDDGWTCWTHTEGFSCLTRLLSRFECESVGGVVHQGRLGRNELHRQGCGEMEALGEVVSENGVALCCSGDCGSPSDDAGAECEREAPGCPWGAFRVDPGECPMEPTMACWLHDEGVWCATRVISRAACESIGEVLTGSPERAVLHRQGCGEQPAVAEVAGEEGPALCCSNGCGTGEFSWELMCRSTWCSSDLATLESRHICGDDPENPPGDPDPFWYETYCERRAGCGLVMWKCGPTWENETEVFDQATGELVGIEHYGSGPNDFYGPECRVESFRAGTEVPTNCDEAVVQYCGRL